MIFSPDTNFLTRTEKLHFFRVFSFLSIHTINTLFPHNPHNISALNLRNPLRIKEASAQKHLSLTQKQCASRSR